MEVRAIVRDAMVPTVHLSSIILLASFATAAAEVRPDDDSLKIFTAIIVQTLPYKPSWQAEGVYLGHGKVITAAHVVASTTVGSLTIRLGGQKTFPAKVDKSGASDHIDLALLSVDEGALPMSLRMRNNPLCEGDVQSGTEVYMVNSNETVDSHTLNPLAIAPELQQQYRTLTETPGLSGSGLFDAGRKCLLGIMSAKMQKFGNQAVRGRVVKIVNGFAGYYVPASVIAAFIYRNVSP